MKQDNFWTIASASKTRYRESSFGGRASSSLDLYDLRWDPSAEAFVQGDLHGFGCGNSWNRKSFRCSKQLALEILMLCATEEVQKRFFQNSYSETPDSELYCCADSLVRFSRSAAHAERLRYILLASFSFQFYSPDVTIQTISLGYELSQSLASNLKGAGVEKLSESINKIRIAA